MLSNKPNSRKQQHLKLLQQNSPELICHRSTGEGKGTVLASLSIVKDKE